jgi:hypothetical protein
VKYDILLENIIRAVYIEYIRAKFPKESQIVGKQKNN